MTGEEVEEWLFNITPTAAGTTVLVAALWMAKAAFWEVPDVGNVPAPKSNSLTLLVVETDQCGWCKRFRRDVLPTYGESPQALRAPLKSVQLHELPQRGYRLAATVRSVPTFILIDRNGNEIDRIAGYPGAGRAFYTAIDRMLARDPSGS
jgi:hypothetical protein